MTAEQVIDEIEDVLNRMKREFLRHDYDDNTMGWIVEDRIYEIQNLINDFKNREFKQTEPDPFA